MLIYLTSDPNIIEYTIFNEAENRASESKKISVEELIIEAIKHPRVILLAPGVEVIAMEKTLPPMPTHKLLKALPFAIEEQLLAPIDTYHLAITQTQENGTVSLLVILKNTMREYLRAFQQRMIFSSFLPDYLLLPYETGVWHIAIEKFVLIRTGKVTGIACDKENWQPMLSLLWHQQAVESKPSHFCIHQYFDPQEEEKQTLDLSAFTILPVSIEKKIETVSLLQHMAEQAQQEKSPANLLVGSFAQESHLSSVKKAWLLAGYMLAIAFIISFVSAIIEYIVLDHQDHLVQAQITSLYKKIYPQATSVVAPELRLTRTLDDLQANQEGAGYLGVLTLSAQAFKQVPRLSINSLHYQDDKLMIEVQADNFKTLDLALDKLHQAGLIATQDQGTTKDNQVTARFTILNTSRKT